MFSKKEDCKCEPVNCFEDKVKCETCKCWVDKKDAQSSNTNIRWILRKSMVQIL